RGGGSFEDLLPFNEEDVVRAFYNSKVPIISAVGHQIDHPLSDDAADYAAPTPSAAAEIAIPVKEELQDYIDSLYSRAYSATNNRIREFQGRIEGMKEFRIFRNPMEIIYNKELILSDTQNRLISTMKEIIAESRKRLLLLPDVGILIRNSVRDCAHKFSIAVQALEMLSPAGILERGYSIATDVKGKIIKSIKELKKGDNMTLVLYNGSADCSVNSVEDEVYFGREKEAIK
ncbi:MAG: hypothetical protein GY863_15545, partial [bacterium]|nr:hypothetical protein [bacterium]